VQLARELGYLDIPPNLLVENPEQKPKEKMLILATGSQGEPRSALNRMADGQHPTIKVGPGDTIIVSGGTIPGNEEDVGRMLNRLFERGANVIYGAMATVHVSGHGSQDELRTMIETVRPKYLIPVHGESRHLHVHARLAQATDMDSDHVFILRNGLPWVTDGQRAWTDKAMATDDVFVDGRLIGEIGEIVLRDRHRLDPDGFVVALIPINKRRELAGEPQIISQGFVYPKGAEALMDAAKAEIKRQYKQGAKNLERALEDFFYHKTQSRPIVVPRYIQV
jgi:ribonuclease J